MTSITRLTLVGVAVLALSCCGRHGAGPGNAAQSLPEPPSHGGTQQAQREVAPGVTLAANRSFAKITWQPTVRRVAAKGFLASLVAVSSDGHTLVFHDAPEDIRALKGGDVLLIENELVRKVLGAAEDEGDIYLVTDSATIGDVVKDGEINVDVPLIFSRATVARAAPPGGLDPFALLIPNAQAQDPAQVARQQAEEKGQADALKNLRGKVTSGWTVTKLQYATDDNTLTYVVALAKNVSGFVGQVAASGYISNFRFWSHVQVSQGLISSFTVGVMKLGGKLHFDWEVAKGTRGGWNVTDPVKLPGTLSVPLGPLLAGLPLTLEVSSAILIHPALTGGDQIQTGGFTITLTGGLNGSVSSGGAVDQGSSIEQTFQITNDSGLSAVAPDAMVIAYAAPRFELQLNPFGPYGKTLADAADKWDKTANKYVDKMSRYANQYAPGLVDAWKNLALFKTVSNVLKSNADVYAQLVATEGVVHSPAVSMVPCSKKWIELSAQVGTAANIAGMTPNAKRSATVYSKKYSKADPPSQFCESVGD